MKDERVGWLPFVLTVTFSLGLLWALVCAAKGCLTGSPWFNLSDRGALIGFFGFGIPMLLAALATTHIWRDHKDLLKVYGWASSILGCIFGICLFIVVGYETTANEQISPAIIIFFLAFGTPMVLLGNSGLRALYPQDPPDCMGKD